MTSVERCGTILVSDTADAGANRLQARAAVSVESLVHTHSPLLFRVAHAVLRNRAEAEDAVQEAFLRVLAHQETLPEIDNLRVWLVRIVWRLALDRKRRITPGQMDEAFARSLVSRTVPADQALAEAAALRAVLQQLERLPSTERNVLLLSAVDEMKTADLAAVLGKSEAAVRALLFRARARLRERLEHNGKGRR